MLLVEEILVMPEPKKDIINQLQKEILALQGFKNLAINKVSPVDLGPIETAFPNGCFPEAGIHEFISTAPQHEAATNGFIATLMAAFMRKGGASVWIGTAGKLFPPSLKIFGIEPDKIIFIDLRKEKDILWVMEEVLKCNGIALVVGELPELSFTSSRRLQLAVEQSRLTGFIIRNNPRNLNVNACISRWRITPLPTLIENDIPGIGFPRWNVELLKIRNGKPGSWQMEWSAGRFRFISPLAESLQQEQKRKTG